MITVANVAHHKQYGYGDGELIGRSILDFVTDSERERLRRSPLHRQFLVGAHRSEGTVSSISHFHEQPTGAENIRNVVSPARAYCGGEVFSGVQFVHWPSLGVEFRSEFAIDAIAGPGPSPNKGDSRY